MQYTNQPIAVTNSRPSPSQVNLSQRVNLPIPKDANKNKDKCLLNIDANTIEIYKLNESDKLVKIDELIFDRGSVRKFSSYNFYD